MEFAYPAIGRHYRDMNKLFAGMILSTVFSLGSAQANLEVQPLNDNNSLRTHIALPFYTKSPATSSHLREVRVRQNANCKSLVDPYILNNFFVKCTSPGSVTLDIIYVADGVARSTVYGPFSVINISETGTVVDEDGGDSGPSEEWLLGQTLWSSTKGINGKQSCASCHGSPGTKAHSISMSSLNAALAQSYMAAAIPLNEAEKQALVKFVQSYR